VVDPSRRCQKRWRVTCGTTLRPIPVLVALLMFALFQADAQSPPSTPIGEARVTRLQDSLDTGDDWEIGVPPVEPESSFATSIRDGSALDSEAYLRLDRDLRQVQRQLQARPEDESGQRRLAEIRRVLVERIEININFDYLYAATVYIEMLRQADGSVSTIRQLSQRLSERRSVLRDSG